jgi:transposase
MYRIHLTREQHEELRQRIRQKGGDPHTRERLEMVRLADAGWSCPQIARYVGQHEQTVRAWIKAFVAGGVGALPNKPRGGKQSALTPALLEALRTEIGQGQRTWTAAQAGAWLAERYGVRLSVDRLRIHLKRAQLTYQRTSRSLRHKQDQEQVAARTAELAALEKKGTRSCSTCATSMKQASA